MKRVLMFLAVLLLSVSAWATSLTCSIDDGALYFTGKTQSTNGRMFYQHKCVQNHYYWLTQEQMNQ